jgi:serine/threonine-protein kinase
MTSIAGELRYEIVRKIYEGGMGIVYEGLQHGSRSFLKRVAIKVIREKYARQPEFIENFIGEAKLVADLIHTNIVQTYHLGETGGACYICMELIRGVNLEQFCEQLHQRGRKLPIELAVFIVSRVARGLAYAHAKTDRDGNLLGIVHRDVSPKNIMIAFEGDVKLTDFGIAKARGFLKDKEGEEVAGKPEYMSPEQADFQITDKRSDIFSAGIVLSVLLTGQNIFKCAAAEESRQRVVECRLPDFRELNPEIDPRLNQLLQKAMARMPADRYQTAEELLYELEYFIYHRGYGPTNETLGKFIRELFAEDPAPRKAVRGGTMKMPAGTKGSTRGTQTGSTTRSTTRSKTPAPVRGSSLFDQIKKKLR